MPDFGIFRGFNEKLFGDKLYAGQLPTQLGIIGSQEVVNFVGLLDLYPNAAAAYSLRQLRSAYTGSAIRVRRTNLDEIDIGFTTAGELNTAALLAFTGTGALDNGFVTTWYDQSGGSNNLTQTLALNQPKIVNAGNVITTLGGKPTCLFSGNQWIFKNWSLNLPQPYTNISVNRYTSLASGFPYIMRNEYGNDANLSLMGFLIGDGNRIFNGSNLNHSVAAVIDKDYLWFAIPNTQSTINNVTTFGNSGARGLTGGVTLGTYNGATGALNGFISEQIIYAGSQSLNQTNIQNNINSYYGIY
jgi:hypothetical protein